MKITYRDNGRVVILQAETPHEQELLSLGAEYEFTAVRESHERWKWIFAAASASK